MHDHWLFGRKKCRIMRTISRDEVEIELENGCKFIIFASLVVLEEGKFFNNFFNVNNNITP